MLFLGSGSKPYSHNDLSLSIGTKTLENVHQYGYLGVTINDKLSFKAHINGLISHFSQKVFLLFKIRQYLTENVALTIHKSLILFLVDYGGMFVI